jgi:UDPglucose 6-dehydrogenase
MFLDSFGCPILPMRYESAELAKISINMCLIASVSVANMLAEICENIGADWSEIVPSLKLDKRIGPHAYLASGLGLSGGNLERDLTTISLLAERHQTDAMVAEAFARNSRHRKQWPWQVLKTGVLDSKPHAAIAVWGLAYKENTHSTKNSPAIALLDHLKGREIAIYDPAVSADAVGFPGSGRSSALEASEGADVLCIMTPWPEFRSVSPGDIVARMRGRYVIDPYRVLDPVQARAAGLQCATLGLGPC